MGDNRVTQAYKRDLVGVETTSLYMRPGKGKTLADMPADKLMRGMCAKSCCNVDVCRLYGLCKVLQVSSDKLLGLEADS